VKIINHGSLEKSNIQKLYNCSKATIYPSLNESFGLGIIEALTAGCDVIGLSMVYQTYIAYFFAYLLFEPTNNQYSHYIIE